MFQIFPICIIFLNLHTMSPLQISDICRQSLLSIHFLQTIIQTLCRSHFQHQLEKQSFNVVYIDIFCRHLQTLFHVLVDNFIIIKKLLYNVQFFVNNCSSQTHKLLACCLRRHYSRSLQTILQTLLIQSEFFIQTQFFLSMQTFCRFSQTLLQY